MNDKISLNSKRVIKNTLMLYFRMFFIMGIGLYTSRVILQTLGVVDFGIYNAVGGFVALFAIVSKSLSGAASRFLNYEMGRGNAEMLKKVFSTTVTIQLILCLIIVVLAETVGLWFLNNKLVIPDERVVAAKYCFQLSLITFCMHLVSVPYNAAIIAHEDMKTFAFVSIVEGVAKLGIAFLIAASPIDNLIYYAILLCALQVVIQLMYVAFCKRNYRECTCHFVHDKVLFKQLFSYAGWGFIGSTSGVLRNQGINVLLNMFFGPAINAARAVSNQVLHAVDGFVQNFMTAVKPQMTQLYAAEKYDDMIKIMLLSMRYSYYLFLLISLPIIMNAASLLNLWLKNVPDYSVLFVQLTLIFTMITTISHPLSIAQAATGKIRDYQIVIGGLQLLNLPISYVCLKMGFSAESVLFVAIGIAFVVVWVSLYMIKKLVPINPKEFCKAIFKLLFVTIIVFSLSIAIAFVLPSTTIFSMIQIVLEFVIALVVVAFIGCSSNERLSVKKMFLKKIMGAKK